MTTKNAKKIVLDEALEAERILSQPPGKYISMKDMILICAYYYGKGLDTKNVRKKLVSYCSGSDYFNFTIRDKSIDKAITLGKMRVLKSSDYKIAITKKEVDRIKKLPYLEYKIALYMLFIAKLDKYQKIRKKEKRAKSFSLYFNYDFKTAYYNVVNEKNAFNGNLLLAKKGISRDKEIEMVNHLISSGVVSLTLTKNFKINFADFENAKNVAFIIDATKPFFSQIKYYCIECGTETIKNKRHDFCENCFQQDLRKRKTESMRKLRT